MMFVVTDKEVTEEFEWSWVKTGDGKMAAALEQLTISSVP